MSSLGDLLLGKVNDRSPSPAAANIKREVAPEYQSKEEEPRQYHHVDRERRSSPSLRRDHDGEPRGKQKIASRRQQDGSEDADDEKRSNASSTDDYVRELLDPNDRPRNVWHVVEGPKGSPENSSHSHDAHRNLQREGASGVVGGNGHSSPVSRDDEDYHVAPGNPNTQIKTERDEQMRAVINEARFKSAREREDEIDENPSNPPPNYDRKPDDQRHRAAGEVDAERDRGIDDSRDREHDHDRHRERRSEHHSSDRRHHHHHHHPDKDETRTDRHKDERGHRRRRSDDKYKSRRSKDDERSDDDGDEDYRYKKDRKHRKSSRSRSRSRSRVSRTSSSRRRERSRSESRSPVTKRDARTVLVMQLSPRVVARDLEDFFNDVGRVKEVRLIMDNKTRRHKGIAYIEFEDTATASRALASNGKKIHGVPMYIQSALSDKNSKIDYHSGTASTYNSHSYPTSSHSSSRSLLPPNSYRVYAGGLHVALTEEMLRSVFEPFGPLIRVELMKDRNTGISRGYAFLTYANINDGMEAVRCLDGFELAD